MQKNAGWVEDDALFGQSRCCPARCTRFIFLFFCSPVVSELADLNLLIPACRLTITKWRIESHLSGKSRRGGQEAILPREWSDDDARENDLVIYSLNCFMSLFLHNPLQQNTALSVCVLSLQMANSGVGQSDGRSLITSPPKVQG